MQNFGLTSEQTFTKILLQQLYVCFSLKDIFHERAWLKTNIFNVQVRISCLSVNKLQISAFVIYACVCYPRESFREGLWNHRRTFVCLSVTTITK